MTKNIQFITIGALLLGGCSLADDNFEIPDSAEPAVTDADEAVGEVQATPAPAETVSGIPVEKQCYGAPIVGRLHDFAGGSCDLDGHLPEGWTGIPLFEVGSPVVEALPFPVPQGLDNWCRFDFQPENPDDVDWGDVYNNFFEATAGYDPLDDSTLAADCLAYAPMGDGLQTADIYDDLRESFAHQIDLPDPGYFKHVEFDKVNVRLLDTADETHIDGGGDPGNFHAVQMESLIEDIACSPEFPKCRDNIEQVLVTPRDEEYQPKWTTGRSLGVLSDFALGAFASVQTWLNDPETSGEHKRLILNASVGADLYALYAMDPSRGSLAATIEMLEWASCYGVLVIAASGNVRDESCDIGENDMLVPAMFEHLASLSPGQCDGRGFWPTWDTNKWPVFPKGGGTRPLVYAAGGVGFDDEPIPNARPNSMPRQVVTAANAITVSGETPLTGSSVAAAALTATARLGWGYNSALRPDQLMDLIYSGSYVTANQATDGHWMGWDQHRLSVCGALKEIGAPTKCTMPDPDPNLVLSDFVSSTLSALTTR